MDRVSRHISRASKIRVVPNFTSSFTGFQNRPQSVQSSFRILFIGSMGYSANIDGVNWFLERIWSRVLRLVPEAHLQVVGRWNSDYVFTDIHKQPNVEICGFVEDATNHWKQADAFISPLRLGTGTRIKIIEAMSRGVPVVSTSVGIEGINVLPNVHALIADTPDHFAHSLLRLKSNPMLRSAMSSASYDLARSLYSLERVGQLAASYCLDTILSRLKET